MKDLIERILSDKDAKQGLHVNIIASRIHEITSGSMFPDENHPQLTYEEIVKKVSSILAADVKKVTGGLFMKIKQKNGSFKKGIYKLKGNKKVGVLPTSPVAPVIRAEEPEPKQQPMNLFLGKAGECAVMSELLFRGYNVNTMMVDDGVDIVASKSNVFYFIQVKTATLKNNIIHSLIKINRFNAFAGIQIRYIVVARCNIAGIDSNMYFLFNNDTIQKYIYDGVLKASDDNINIKIKIDIETRRPYIYNDNKQQDISFYMNRFEL